MATASGGKPTTSKGAGKSAPSKARAADEPVAPPSAADDRPVDPYEAVAVFAAAAVERLVALRDLADEPAALQRAERTLAAARAVYAESLTTPSPLGLTVLYAGMNIEEAEVFGVAMCVERDERLQRLLAHVHADGERMRLEVGTLATLLGPDHSGPLTVGPRSALRRAALVRLTAGSTWSRQAVVVEPAVMWALAGDSAADPDLPAGYEVLAFGEPPEGGARNVLVTGTDRIRRRAVGGWFGAARRYLVGRAPTDERGWAALVREATVFGAGAMVELDGPLGADGRQWIQQAQHLSWVLTAKDSLALDTLPDCEWRELQASDMPATDEEWHAAVGAAERRHLLSAEQLEQVARTLPLVGGDVDAAVRRLVSSRLESLARRIRPSRTWDDLILPPGHVRQLHELVDRYHLADRVYGEWQFPAVPSRGLVALFSGPSGTGKTLAAEVMAGELGLDLFKLNLSSVVSKFIGETEKNLDELFDAAGAGNLVLFFDEADALFGRRSEVKDAHDKYANMETSYLLQRLETYDGVVIMATNFEKNIDEAFLRRIHTRVDFAVPSEAERVMIWRRHLDHGATIDGVDFDELAHRFDFAGGAIRNAAVHAAFLAASEDGVITMQRAMRGVAREYRKLGRLLRKDDFGQYFSVVSGDLDRT